MSICHVCKLACMLRSVLCWIDFGIIVIMYSITAHAAQVNNSWWFPAKACMQAAHASILHTAHVCCTALAPLLCLTRAARFAGSHVQHYRSCRSTEQLLMVCCQSMHASSTCKCLAVQHKCVAQHKHHCSAWQGPPSLQAALYSITAHAAQVNNSWSASWKTTWYAVLTLWFGP